MDKDLIDRVLGMEKTAIELSYENFDRGDGDDWARGYKREDLKWNVAEIVWKIYSEWDISTYERHHSWSKPQNNAGSEEREITSSDSEAVLKLRGYLQPAVELLGMSLDGMDIIRTNISQLVEISRT